MSKESRRRFFKVFYKNFSEHVDSSIVGFGDNYRENDSYHENLLDVVSRMVEDGGLWIDSNTLIPFHRIVMFRPYDLNDNGNNGNNGNNDNNGNNGNNGNHGNGANNINNGNNENSHGTTTTTTTVINNNGNKQFIKKSKRIRMGCQGKIRDNSGEQKC